MKKMLALFTAMLLLTLSCVSVGYASEMNYDIFPEWGISIASPDYTEAVYREDEGNYYIYTMTTGSIPYVMVKPYADFESEEAFVEDFFLDFMKERYADLQVVSELTPMKIGGKSCLEIEFDYTVEGYHVLDRRIFKTVEGITYMFCSKEIGELELTLGTLLEDIFAASIFLAQPIEIDPDPQPEPEPEPQPQPEPPVIGQNPDEEIFLIVTRYYQDDESSDPDMDTFESAYVVKAGEDLALGGADDLTITITSVTGSEVTFTVNNSSGFSAGGVDEKSTEFTIPRDETLKIVNQAVAGYYSAYEFEVADVNVTRVDNIGGFAWDMDGDGSQEQVAISSTNNGDTYHSYNYFTITEEDGSTWDAYLDHANEILSVRIIEGPFNNFLILETGADSFGEGATSYVVLYDGSQTLSFIN